MSTIETPDPEEITAETAFNRCDAHTFKGQKLEPLTALRQAAALACGLKYGNVGPDDLIHMAGGTIYKQFFADCVIVLYLCSSPKAVASRAFSDPTGTIEAAMDWADAQGLSYGSEVSQEAAATFIRIMEDLAASTGSPQHAKSDTEGTALPNK